MSDNTARPDLDPVYTLQEVAAALGMSTRWVRDECNKNGAAHLKFGHKIKFTAAQVEALRESKVRVPELAPVQSITTGKKKSR